MLFGFHGQVRIENELNKNILIFPIEQETFTTWIESMNKNKTITTLFKSGHYIGLPIDYIRQNIKTVITKSATSLFWPLTFAYQLKLLGFKQLIILIVNVLLNSSFQGLFAGVWIGRIRLVIQKLLTFVRLICCKQIMVGQIINVCYHSTRVI